MRPSDRPSSLHIERRAKTHAESPLPSVGAVIPESPTMQRLPPEPLPFGVTESYLRTSSNFGSRASSTSSGIFVTEAALISPHQSSMPENTARPKDEQSTEFSIQAKREEASAEHNYQNASQNSEDVGLEDSDRSDSDEADETGDETAIEPPLTVEQMDSMLRSVLDQQTERRDELDDYMHKLLEQSVLDDEGRPLVEFPPDFAEMIEQGVSSTLLLQSFSESDYETNVPLSEEERKLQEGLSKIRELDRVLSKKTKEAREISKRLKSRATTSDANEQRDAFSNLDGESPEEIDDARGSRQTESLGESSEIPRLELTRRYSTASVQRSLRKSKPQSSRKFIEKNIQNASQFSRLYTLNEEDNQRVESLLNENDDQLPNFGFDDDSVSRLAEINRRLQKLVVPTEWDSKSISDSGSFFSGSSSMDGSIMSDQVSSIASNSDRPRDYLKEHREERELTEKMRFIDDMLYKFRQETTTPSKPIDAADIQRLIIQHHKEIALINGSQPNSRPTSSAGSDLSSRRPSSSLGDTSESQSLANASLARANLENALKKAAQVAQADKQSVPDMGMQPPIKGARVARRGSSADSVRFEADSQRSGKTSSARSHSSMSSLASTRAQNAASSSSTSTKSRSKAPIPKHSA
eukprot:TRINITY_DN8434_c0_g1_i4.p1 TRINITY_DN8434_c0_g1~~TRINITY_DN8434_c0_g1_i4.p1  ORF type:complete len:639 (-),score=153.34 TRINITY_DN8434_c0_g1_i4:278-2194(-)